jgi:hypothetical protein
MRWLSHMLAPPESMRFFLMRWCLQKAVIGSNLGQSAYKNTYHVRCFLSDYYSHGPLRYRVCVASTR